MIKILAKFKGIVKNINHFEFEAHVKELETEEELCKIFSLNKVEEDKRDKIQIGDFFYWTIFTVRLKNGNYTLKSSINFPSSDILFSKSEIE